MDQPKIERVLRLMKMMTGNTNYTISDMAERLEISERSIYRYIDTFKESGFVVHRKEGGIFRLGKESRYFKDISQLIHFTDEEAHIVNELIEGLANTNVLKQNLRKKLSAVYNCTSFAECIVEGKNAINVNRLSEAISKHKQVILKDYASSHSGAVSDRRVEPFGFTHNYVQVWCFEPESGKNKLFNTVRIGSAEVQEQDWEFEQQHNMGHIDIFRISGFEQYRLELELGVMSHNLLLEEYPLACRYLKQIDETHWYLDTMVCSYAGAGRFVMGLSDDIKIITPEFKEYIRKRSQKILENLND